MQHPKAGAQAGTPSPPPSRSPPTALPCSWLLPCEKMVENLSRLLLPTTEPRPPSAVPPASAAPQQLSRHSTPVATLVFRQYGAAVRYS